MPKNDNEEFLEGFDCNCKYIRIVAKIQFAIQSFVILFFVCVFMIELRMITQILYIGIPVFLILALIFAVNLRNHAYKTKNLIRKYPEKNSNNNHHAIIIAYFTSPKKDGNYELKDYMDGIDILIEKFQNADNPVNYKVYEVETKEDAQKIICNPKTTHLWIFGHGMRNKLQFEKGDLFYYFAREANKKEFIGQYHCNSYFGKSLADYNKPKNSDVNKWPRFNPFIRLAVEKKLIELY